MARQLDGGGGVYYCLEDKGEGRAGGRVVRAHAIYAAHPGSNPDRRSFAAFHTPPLTPMFPIGLLLNKGVYANKILKED